MFDQFLRSASLIVSDFSGSGKDLSTLRFSFRTFLSDFETPNHVEIRVYNLASNTANQIRNEFTQVGLQAGYRNGPLGVIFAGTIKQVRIGRENQTDTYLDIAAADGDIGYNQGFVSTNVPPGTSILGHIQALAKASPGLTVDPAQINFAAGYNAPNIRGKVYYGATKAYFRDIASSGLARWSIQNGTLRFTPLTAYSDTQAVVINSQTGMIGLPEQTQDGITVTCLLNPLIRPGTQIQINESSIQRAKVSVNPNDTPFTSETAFPTLSIDGFYTALVVEHEGDTRGNPWYSHITALSVDKTVAPNVAVKAAG